MQKYKFLRAALFVYDIARLLILAFLPVLFSQLGGGIFPFLVYLTPNTLFPMMTLFIFLRFAEFRNYLPLYLAGKIIAVFVLYIWGMVFLKAAMDESFLDMGENNFNLLLGGNFILGLGDVLSILGAWFLSRKTRFLRLQGSRPAVAVENGGQ